ncbi:DNA phosphorothioation-dependent restriction protein DptG [Aliivibrio fischeri]|uniref:DNA phosphorothioation-dependent restriction protein DptG n=1 Tax=Aliivibrio fischeri TaxID=668 RepID=UPI00084C13A7|nr:DNA phosphorothioation-dependent restriction protein DptG [Aliivibrio fischeri]OED51111.1 DNA phosphorothioation-dependent restriction protein DptG [Aliivibrio fischeri]
MNITRIIDNTNSIKKMIEECKTAKFQNVADTYLPIGPTTIEKQGLDWPSVYKAIIEISFNTKSKLNNWPEVQSKLSEHFSTNRETRDLISIINEIYLNSTGLRDITPLAYLVCEKKSNARTNSMENIFIGLLSTPGRGDVKDEGNNLLEKLVIEALKSNCIANNNTNSKKTYLPFLSELFTKDIEELKSSTSWFVDEFENLIELYSFLYLTHLSISIGVPRLRYDLPKSQPLYFILENETASKDRYECNAHGYNYIFSKTTGHAKKIFPYLGYLNWITDQPLWDLLQDDSPSLTQNINHLNSNISILFNEPYQEALDYKSAVEKGLDIQYRVIMKTDRKTANEKVVNVFHDVFSRNFITNRRSAGSYFELKSSTLMLLTNLVIGKGNKLLIDDVVDAFKERGIWLDILSKNALLKFYESVGNCEKLSDSGDAVYVKSTI